jgi:hypothetical protein
MPTNPTASLSPGSAAELLLLLLVAAGTWEIRQ